MAEIEGEGRGPTSVLVAAVVAEAVERAGKALALARRIEPLIGRSYANRTVSAWAREPTEPAAIRAPSTKAKRTFCMASSQRVGRNEFDYAGWLHVRAQAHR